MVVTVIAAVMAVITFRGGSARFWSQEGFIRRLSEVMTFLHHQAVVDGEFYRLEFDFDRRQYSIGVMKSDDAVDEHLSDIAEDAGSLTLELASRLSPSLGEGQTVIPPPSFPSLAEPVSFPEGVALVDVRTMRGVHEASQGGTAWTLFSPRGFSEFAVVHLELDNGSALTILVNPFTGLTEVFREYRDFEWTYGRTSEDRRQGAE